MRYFFRFIAILMIIFSFCLFGCDGNVGSTLPEIEQPGGNGDNNMPETDQPGENIPEEDNSIIKVPELAISRVYIPQKGQAKFFAVTNTSDRDIDLSSYSFAIDNTTHEKTQKFPHAVLAAGKTLFCPNSFICDRKSDLDYFKSIFPVIASLPEYSNGTRIDEDSVCYGIKGYYKGESSMEIVTNVTGDSWMTVDEASVNGAYPQKPSALLRAWNDNTYEDLGWIVLDPASSDDRKALESGIYEGDPIGPVKPNPDKPEHNRPDENGDNPNINPEYGGEHTDIKSPIYGEKTQPDNIALGMPIYMKGAEYEANNHIVLNPTQVSGYNDLTHNPNWVAWHLGPEVSGRGFRTETVLPAEMRTVNSDYETVSYKYNRGHMCPNGDHHDGTYTMVNIVPQDIIVNREQYRYYEEAMRRYNKGKEYFSVAGPSIQNDGTFKGKTTKLQFDIPSFVWRATIIIDEKSGDDLARMNSGKGNPKAYAIWMPNDCDKMVWSNWEDYIVSIDFIESKTGLDLFPDLDDAIEAEIEAQNKGSKAEQRYR